MVDRVFPDRRSAGIATRRVCRTGPRPRSWSWSRVTAREANGVEAAMPLASLAGIRSGPERGH